MAKYTIDLGVRLAAAFGNMSGLVNAIDNAVGLGYKIVPAIPDEDNRKPLPVRGYTQDEILTYSKMGTPLVEQLILSYHDDAGLEVQYEFELPPFVDLDLNKRLNITPISDGDFVLTGAAGGEVIESWGNAPWDITLRGILVDMDNHNMPIDQLKAFTDFFKENEVYDVKSSRIFNALKVGQIFIKSVKLPSIENFIDTQPFVINARSYVPAELFIAN